MKRRSLMMKRGSDGAVLKESWEDRIVTDINGDDFEVVGGACKCCKGDWRRYLEGDRDAAFPCMICHEKASAVREIPPLTESDFQKLMDHSDSIRLKFSRLRRARNAEHKAVVEELRKEEGWENLCHRVAKNALEEQLYPNPGGYYGYLAGEELKDLTSRRSLRS